MPPDEEETETEEQETEEEAPQEEAEVERDSILAQARELIAKNAAEANGTHTNGQAKPAGKPAVTKAKPKEEPPPEEEEEEPELARILRERETRASPKLADKDLEFQQRLHNLAIQEVRLKQDQEEVSKNRGLFDLLKKDPAKALRELGADPTEYARSLASAVAPENPEVAQLKSMVEQLALKLDEQGKHTKELLETKGQLENYAKQEQTRKENEFLKKHLEEGEAYTFAKYAFLGDDEAISKRARELAAIYCEVKGEKTCPWPTLVAQLKSESTKKLEALAKDEDFLKLIDSLRQKGATGPKGSPGKKPASPTARDASTRRAAPKAPQTEGDERDMLIAAARQAKEGMSKPA